MTKEEKPGNFTPRSCGSISFALLGMILDIGDPFETRFPEAPDRSGIGVGPGADRNPEAENHAVLHICEVIGDLFSIAVGDDLGAEGLENGDRVPYLALHHQLEIGDEISAAPIRNLSVTWHLHVNRARRNAMPTRSVIAMLTKQVKNAISEGGWSFAEVLVK